MLTNWRLTNFKSVADSESLDLSPLTIFAGPNNSGKSTVIQSILLTSQTVQSKVTRRPVVLNGHVVRLGDYQDIVHGSDVTSNIDIGFTLELPPRSPRTRGTGASRSLYPYYYRRFPSDASATIKCSYQFGSSSKATSGRRRPFLRQTSLDVRVIGEETDRTANISLHKSQRTIKERLNDFDLIPGDYEKRELDALGWEVRNIFPYQPDTTRRDLLGLDYIGASVSHFLPRWLVAAYDQTATEVRQVLQALIPPSPRDWEEYSEPIHEALQRKRVRRILLEQIDKILSDIDNRLEPESLSGQILKYRQDEIKNLTRQFREGAGYPVLHDLYARLPKPLSGALAEVLEREEDDLRNAIRHGREERYDLSPAQLPDLIRTGSRYLENYFSSFVRYIGPLRDRPKSVYPLSEQTDPEDVGLKGEYTAAVLDIHSNTAVEFVRPPADEALSDNATRTTASLTSAVREWLEYMGMGSDLRPVDRGKLGHSLDISTGERAKFHDLTQVGVGVSQVLPILVSSLLAPRGSVLIFEQPELHLHPKVQARIGDFFLSMAELDKQCIVETHSEYLINQLRYRAATGSDDDVAEKVGIYFVEMSEGQSHYRPVEINEYGVIEDWPEGFFDETERTTAAILEASLRKRKEAQQDNRDE